MESLFFLPWVESGFSGVLPFTYSYWFPIRHSVVTITVRAALASHTSQTSEKMQTSASEQHTIANLKCQQENPVGKISCRSHRRSHPNAFHSSVKSFIIQVFPHRTHPSASAPDTLIINMAETTIYQICTASIEEEDIGSLLKCVAEQAQQVRGYELLLYL